MTLIFTLFLLLFLNKKIYNLKKVNMQNQNIENLVYIKPVNREINENEIIEGFAVVKKIYGIPIAKNVEKIFRLETAHFKSIQFKTCFSAGMEIFGEKFPYGWTSCLSLWQRNPDTKPYGYTIMNDGTGNKRFLCFKKPLHGFLALAEFLTVHKNNPGRWYSTKKELQERYNETINKIKNLYV